MENVIIIGAGPAGISAALYAARGNLNPLVINNGIGALEKAEKIENYYGLEQPLSGSELYERGLEQARHLGVRILEAQVLGIGGFDTFTVKTTEGDFDTISVILATGGKRSTPKIPGIQEFEGRGVSYCAVCDGYFFKDKTVAVIGGGNTAVTEATYLSHICKRVFIIHRGDALKADRVLVQKLEKSGNVKILYNTNVVKIDGDEKVKSVTLDNEKILKTDGVFVAVGLEPRTGCVKGFVKTDDNGYVIADETCQTSVSGIFVAGDIRTKNLRQIITACCDGANSVYGINKFLKL